MNEGLYKVQFQTPKGAGVGVVYLKNGQMYGGDSALYYAGSYQLDGDSIAATFRTDAHTKNSPVSESVFGVDRVNVTLNGVVSGNNISTIGSASEAPGLTFKAELVFLCE
jgi:hypothetical protein